MVTRRDWWIGVGVVLLIPLQTATRATQDAAIEARSPRWRCEVEKKWECDVTFGCQGVAASDSVWMALDFPEKTYQRCDAVGCDSYPMEVVERGSFTYVRVPDRPGVFLKIGLADMFVDVASLGVSTMNSFGTCRPLR